MEDDEGVGSASALRRVPQAVWLFVGLLVASGAISVLFVVKGPDGGSGAASGKAPPRTTRAPASPTTTKGAGTCRTWAQVTSWVPPPKAGATGVHVWVDASTWHVRLVPGSGLDNVVGIVTIEGGGATQASTVGGGSAVVAPGGGHIDLVSPAGPYEARWKVPCTARRLSIELRDASGASMALDHVDVGAGFAATANPLTFQR